MLILDYIFFSLSSIRLSEDASELSSIIFDISGAFLAICCCENADESPYLVRTTPLSDLLAWSTI